MTTTDTGQDRLIPAEEVAEKLGGGKITAQTVMNRHRHWGLHAVRVGKFTRFRESDVNDFINHTT